MKKLIGCTMAMLLFLSLSPKFSNAAEIQCWFPPAWKSKIVKAKTITTALSAQSGITIKPKVAKSYGQILKAFDSSEQNLVYVGSFVQAIIKARGLGTALVQGVTGKELYSGVLVFPKGGDPVTILKDFPEQIAFAKGASSGESSAKAATNGKAAVSTLNHKMTCGLVKIGKAKAGFVKNWWWDGNKNKFSGLEMYRVPEISVEKNPDNVLTASKAVPVDVQKKIIAAAIASKDVFGATEMVPFDQSHLTFPLSLMEKGKIDPLTYKW